MNSLQSTKGNISINKLEDFLRSYDLDFSGEEFQYVVSVMYKKSRDLDRLPIAEMQKLFKGLIAEYGDKTEIVVTPNPDTTSKDDDKGDIEEKSIEGEEKKEIKDEIESSVEDKIEDNVKSKVENTKNQSVENEEDEKESSEGKSLMLDEVINDGIVETIKRVEEPKEITELEVEVAVRKVLKEIIEKLQELNITPKELFENHTLKDTTDEGDVELIPCDKFLERLKSLKLEIFSEYEQECLMKAAPLTEDDQYVIVDDFIEKLEELKPESIHSNPHSGKESKESKENEKGDKKKFLKKIDKLDKTSMAIMLYFANHLNKLNIGVEDYFENKVHQQRVKTKSTEKVIDLLKYNDFYEGLHDAGVRVEKIENLKEVLSLNKKYNDKIRVSVLKKILKEFTINKELEEYAQKCYQELIEDPSKGQLFVEVDEESSKIMKEEKEEEYEEDLSDEIKEIKSSNKVENEDISEEVVSLVLIH